MGKSYNERATSIAGPIEEQVTITAVAPPSCAEPIIAESRRVVSGVNRCAAIVFRISDSSVIWKTSRPGKSCLASPAKVGISTWLVWMNATFPFVILSRLSWFPDNSTQIWTLAWYFRNRSLDPRCGITMVNTPREELRTRLLSVSRSCRNMEYRWTMSVTEVWQTPS